MAMFDDPKKELAKLEAQLLKEEEWFEKELATAKALIGDEPAPKPKKKKTQKPLDETQVYRTSDAKNTKSTQPATSKKVRNLEHYDVNLDEQSKKVSKSKKKGVKGLVTLAILETLGIVGVVAYWLLFLL